MTAPVLYCPRCATPNMLTATVCQNPSCGAALPRVANVAPAAAAPSATKRDLTSLESQVLFERSRVKSPTGAAVLGFFFPWAGAFYNGKMMMGFALLGLQVLIGVIGVPIGEVPLVLYGVFGAIQSHKWARQANERALGKLVAEQP